ncbi:hypothetical protein INT45_002869 [Circinella minor]|uniref:DUF914-domain-containing protein n=1 Tax=Circinella minor TaxID=1195481 RepID=A0A8H7VQJ8_9FUNG|nr:hypothetical protein INT45_002869 [Circinella minor]
MDTSSIAEKDLERVETLPQQDYYEEQIEREKEKQQWTWRGKTWKERLGFLKSVKFWRVLILGQTLCITGTVVTSTKLGNDYNFNAPTTQTFLVYAVLALIYNSYAIWRRGFKAWCNQFWERGVYYFFLGWVDVEGNYLVVKAYAYTGMLSVMLLDCWSTPTCVILALIFFRVRYRWLQYVGIFLALCGTGMIVGSDAMDGKSWMASDPVKGNFFVIIGTTFYGISNTSVEYLTRKYPIYEVNGSFTLFATLINLVQLLILEREEFSTFVNNGEAVAMVIVYTICMVILYSLAPIMFRWGSAVLYNLSLMTSDFWSLIFGLGLFGYTVGFLYPIAFVVIIFGIGLYYVFPTPEPVIQMPNDPTRRHRKFKWFGFWFDTIEPTQPPINEKAHVQDNNDHSITKEHSEKVEVPSSSSKMEAQQF